MVTIVVGVGATRGWRSTVIGAAAGFAVLAAIVLILGAALSVIPIGGVRLVVGTLHLIFGLQWLRMGIVRVAARGIAGLRDAHLDEGAEWNMPEMAWTAFLVPFNGAGRD